MVVERGRIYWCELDPVQGREQGGTRPVVVVSANAYNKTQSPLAAVVPLTRAVPKTPLHLRFGTADTGLAMESTALIDHLRFIDRSRLRTVADARMSDAALASIDLHLRRALDLL